MTALQRLERAHHPAVPRLIRPVLVDADPQIAAAAIRTLGDIGDDWAIDLLLDALRRGDGSRSRVAAELERLAPAPGSKLAPVAARLEPGGSLLGRDAAAPVSGLGEATLIELTWDADPNVRAAAVETLGTRAATTSASRSSRVSTTASGSSASMRPAPPATCSGRRPRRPWRAISPTSAGGCEPRRRTRCAESAPTPCRRSSSILGHEDAFARNGAAEVLQDIGFVDFLALDNPRSPLLERIYAAGGERFREAAEARIEGVSAEGVRAA